MYAGMSSTTSFASTWGFSGAGGGATGAGGAGGGGAGVSVTFTSIGALPRPVSSRSSGTKPSRSKRSRYAPAGIPSNTARPPSVRVIRSAGPVSNTLTPGIGVPEGSDTKMAKVTAPPPVAPRGGAAALRPQRKGGH